MILDIGGYNDAETPYFADLLLKLRPPFWISLVHITTFHVFLCVHTGNNTGKYSGSVGTNSTNSFIPEAWFMVATSSGKSQGYKDFLNVREYTSLKEVWQNLK